ncbi:MAG: T9SS type A sorting domain-containing protein [Chitinophagales bacterium]
MKPLFTTILFLWVFSTHALQAQTTFAPTGSEWYHTMTYGVYHSYNAGDTVINGIACRKIVRNAETADPWYSEGLHVDNHTTLYVYSTTDTVFVYNTFFHRFTPLYVFNVNDGDTVRLPILPIDDGIITFITTDSTFTFHVDSVRMKLYDTAMLKTVFTHALGNRSTNYVYNYIWNVDSPAAYAERIGSVLFGPMPEGVPATHLTSESVQSEGPIRCYNDPTLSIKMVAGICGIPPVQVASVAKETLSVFPNPAGDLLNITNISPGMSVRIDIADMAGRTIARQVKVAVNGKIVIPVSGLSAGMYLLRLTGEGGITDYRMISIVH